MSHTHHCQPRCPLIAPGLHCLQLTVCESKPPIREEALHSTSCSYTCRAFSHISSWLRRPSRRSCRPSRLQASTTLGVSGAPFIKSCINVPMLENQHHKSTQSFGVTAACVRLSPTCKGKATIFAAGLPGKLSLPRASGSHGSAACLEVCIDNIKALGVLRQLDPDVSTAHKDGLEGLPLLLDI